MGPFNPCNAEKIVYVLLFRAFARRGIPLGPWYASVRAAQKVVDVWGGAYRTVWVPFALFSLCQGAHTLKLLRTNPLKSKSCLALDMLTNSQSEPTTARRATAEGDHGEGLSPPELPKIADWEIFYGESTTYELFVRKCSALSASLFYRRT